MRDGRGDEGQASALIGEAERDAITRSEGFVLTFAEHAYAVLHNAHNLVIEHFPSAIGIMDGYAYDERMHLNLLLGDPLVLSGDLQDGIIGASRPGGGL